MLRKAYYITLIISIINIQNNIAHSAESTLSAKEWLSAVSSGEAIKITNSQKWAITDDNVASFLKSDYGLEKIPYSEKSNKDGINIKYVSCLASSPHMNGGTISTDARLAIGFIYLQEKRFGEERLPRRYSDSIIGIPAEQFNRNMQRIEKGCSADLVISYKKLMLDYSKALEQGITELKRNIDTENSVKQKRMAEDEKTKSEANRKEQILFSEIASLASRSRINGYKDFKFGINEIEVKAQKACSAYYLTAERDRWSVLLGTPCYKIGGQRRPMVFYFASENRGPLLSIRLIFSEYSEFDTKNVIATLSSTYGAADFIPNDSVLEAFNKRKLPRLVLAAFKDWSVVYVAERSKNIGVGTSIFYNSNIEATKQKLYYMDQYKALTSASMGSSLKRTDL